MQTAPVELPGLSGMLSVSLLSLGVVCLLAYLFLRLLSSRYGRRTQGEIRIVERCVLEPRRSVFLIDVRGRHFFIGSGEGGITSLAEFDPSLEPPRLDPEKKGPTPVSFQSILDRFVRRK